LPRLRFAVLLAEDSSSRVRRKTSLKILIESDFPLGWPLIDSQAKFPRFDLRTNREFSSYDDAQLGSVLVLSSYFAADFESKKQSRLN
jgi:hypothetical protein